MYDHTTASGPTAGTDTDTAPGAIGALAHKILGGHVAAWYTFTDRHGTLVQRPAIIVRVWGAETGHTDGTVQLVAFIDGSNDLDGYGATPLLWATSVHYHACRESLMRDTWDFTPQGVYTQSSAPWSASALDDPYYARRAQPIPTDWTATTPTATAPPPSTTPTTPFAQAVSAMGGGPPRAPVTTQGHEGLSFG